MGPLCSYFASGIPSLLDILLVPAYPDYFVPKPLLIFYMPYISFLSPNLVLSLALPVCLASHYLHSLSPLSLPAFLLICHLFVVFSPPKVYAIYFLVPFCF